MNLRESMRRFRTKNLSEQTNFSVSDSDGSEENTPVTLDNSPKTMAPEYGRLLYDHLKLFKDIIKNVLQYRNKFVQREIADILRSKTIDNLYINATNKMTLDNMNALRDGILEINKKWTPFVGAVYSEGLTDLKDQTRRKVENMMRLASNSFDKAMEDFIKGDIKTFNPEMKKSLQMLSNIQKMPITSIVP